MTSNAKWIELVNGAATARGEPPLPEGVVLEALDRCLNGIADVPRYPNGFPSLKAVYEIAREL